MHFILKIGPVEWIIIVRQREENIWYHKQKPVERTWQGLGLKELEKLNMAEL